MSRFCLAVVAALCGAAGATWCSQQSSVSWLAASFPEEQSAASQPIDVLGWLDDRSWIVRDHDDSEIVDAEVESAESLPEVHWQSTATEWPKTSIHLAAATRTPASNAAKRSRPVVGSRTTSGWEVVALSGEGHALHVRTFGQSGPTTLFVAGLDGEDRVAVTWIDRFARQLADSPELSANCRIALLRAANPDGLTVKHHENSRGVSLNRNFPTANYRAGGDPSAGSGPASEPETRALMQTLTNLRPQRVVHVTAGAERSVARCSRTASEAVAQLRTLSGIEIEEQTGPLAPGSLEEFASQVLGLEAITLELRTGDDWRSAGISHLPTLLTAAGSRTGAMQTASKSIAARPRETSDDHAPVSAAAAIPTPRKRSLGYEELPAPPQR